MYLSVFSASYLDWIHGDVYVRGNRTTSLYFISEYNYVFRSFFNFIFIDIVNKFLLRHSYDNSSLLFIFLLIFLHYTYSYVKTRNDRFTNKIIFCKHFFHRRAHLGSISVCLISIWFQFFCPLPTTITRSYQDEILWQHRVFPLQSQLRIHFNFLPF